ncbi:CPBP family intramembrane metalloprotease [Candidatus Aminicenantes bacterium AC-335-A11]|jgi:hypothetical protein|nr:CPBP family intramembrane metalloprotease [SCandidatus Aminicenantes bacterium Aminicenantia_JdfR_composite]MCP2618909.1 CPBP family intramembrane metalloprotease [Candidatus Aminicenantes bacterium AC-335-A11]MCP2620820.1 CPBP family intramembrane metalloprotease [Candidatus Aminicenantes bacterium AC-334-E05]
MQKQKFHRSFIKNYFIWTIIGSILVLILSPAITALTGKENAYALVLLPLNLLLWVLTGLGIRNIGIRIGKSSPIILALFYPIIVIGITGLIAWTTGNIQANNIFVLDTIKNILILFLVGLIGVFLTEEGFFRGWLWGIIEKSGFKSWIGLVWTSVIFCLWHYAVTKMVFHLTGIHIPVYLINILFIGFVFGFLRQMSGSLLAPSIAHALWNALSYTLFGIGEKAGVLNIASRKIFDPEIGLLGLLLNFFAVILFWRLAYRK